MDPHVELVQQYGVYAPTPYDLDIPDALPPIIVPEDNYLTEEGVTLGRMLFYDPILSGDSSQSCSSCHNQAYAFTDDGNRFSLGIDGLPGKTNAMALFNLGYGERFFWNGRALSMEHQAGMPVEDPLEMNAHWPVVETRLNAHPTYPELFFRAFGTSEISREWVEKAIAQFERTIYSGDAPYDTYQPNYSWPTAEAQYGYQMFFSEIGDCGHCHTEDLLTDYSYRNNGLDSVFGPENWGLYEITGDSNDMGKFKVPTLRNIALTAPYMHDGRFNTLEEVLDHYNTGICDVPETDLFLKKPDRTILNDYQKSCILAFLHTLTDTIFLNNPDYSNPFE